MNGAREYAELFRTGQHGRLFITSGSHARGREFHIYVVPEGIEIAEGKYPGAECVEVYGVLGGHLGWTEWYGWKHKGSWQEDFAKLGHERQAASKASMAKRAKEEAERSAERANQESQLLATYRSAS